MKIGWRCHVESEELLSVGSANSEMERVSLDLVVASVESRSSDEGSVSP